MKLQKIIEELNKWELSDRLYYSGETKLLYNTIKTYCVVKKNISRRELTLHKMFELDWRLRLKGGRLSFIIKKAYLSISIPTDKDQDRWHVFKGSYKMLGDHKYENISRETFIRILKYNYEYKENT